MTLILPHFSTKNGRRDYEKGKKRGSVRSSDLFGGGVAAGGVATEKREMDVISSVSMNNGDQIREYIVVLLNGFSGYSEEEIQKEILKKYDENTFNSIRFNQGLSELDGLQVDVYEDKTGYQNGEKIFNFEYPEK